MVPLVYLFVIFLGVQAVPTTCSNYRTRCQAVCTQDAVNGTLITPSNCPIVSDGAFVGAQCDVCPSGRFCESSTGQCLLLSELPGRPCTQDEHCQPYIPDLVSREYVCSAGMCAEAPGQRLYGDGCSSSAQCMGFLFCNMTSGRCDQDPGDQCNSNEECESLSICESGSCVEIEYNANCGGIGGRCVPSQVCNPITEFCQNLFTLDTDVQCDLSDRAKMYGCAGGLQCTYTNVPQIGPLTCQPQIDSVLDCNANTETACTVQHDCLCNISSGVGECFRAFPQFECAQAYRDFIRCTETFGCRSELLRAPPGSCVADFCASRFYSLAICVTQREIEFPMNCNIARNVGVSLGIVTPESTDNDSCTTLSNIFLGMNF